MVATARKQPLYDQLVDILADKIEHEYHAGDMISSERELSERYGLSRTTVRLALQELERLGLIVRQHGRANKLMASILSILWQMQDMDHIITIFSVNRTEWKSI